MLKTLVLIILFVVGLVILGAVIKIVGIGEIAKGFSQFSPWGIIPLLVFGVANHVMAAVKWQYILRTMKIRMGVVPLFKIGLAGYAVSYISPIAFIGGEVFRGYLLKDRYGISWQKALSSISIDKIVEASVWAVVIFIGVILYIFHAGISSFSRTIILSGVSSLFFVGWLVVIYAFSFKKKSLAYPLIIKPFKLQNSKGGKFLAEFENEFFTFFSFHNKKHILVAFKLAVLKNVFLWLRNVFLIYYLVQTFVYSGGIIALAASYLTYSLPIPGALGAHEAALSFIFSGIGLSAGTGAVFTLLVRGADMLLVTIGLIYLFKWGIGFFAFQIMRWLKIESFNGNGGGRLSP